MEAFLKTIEGDLVPIPPERRVDRFIFGDPDKELTGITVGWQSYQWALEKAVEQGSNLFVTHETTFYERADTDSRALALPVAVRKREFLESSGLVVLRCHDLWDYYPGIGITDVWAKLLDVGESIDGGRPLQVLDVSGRTAGEVASHVARQLKPLGQTAVQFIGDPNRSVSRLAIGTGAFTPLPLMVYEWQADIALCTDDGFVYWRDGAVAMDTDTPVIIVNHNVSEEYGMRSLADRLRQEFGAMVPVHFIDQGSKVQLISE